MRLQSAILERRNPEFVDNYCEQSKALIDLLTSLYVFGRWTNKRLLGKVKPNGLKVGFT
jgi:hypothetical protein